VNAEESITRSALDGSKKLERNNLIVVLVGTLISVYWQDRAITLSFLAGGVLAAVNFRLLRLIVHNLIQPQGVSKGKIIAQVVIKFLGGLGALAVIMLVFHPEPLAFLLGLSTIVVVISAEGIFGLYRN